MFYSRSWKIGEQHTGCSYYWHCPRSRVYVTIGRPSVCPPVNLSHHSTTAEWCGAAGLLLSAMRAEDIDCQRGGGRVQQVSAARLNDRVRVADLPGRRRLHSSSSHRLLVPPFRLTTVGRRTFPVAASLLWNSLPSDI